VQLAEVRAWSGMGEQSLRSLDKLDVLLARLELYAVALGFQTRWRRWRGFG
jgi:hypothetical protein